MYYGEHITTTHTAWTKALPNSTLTKTTPPSYLKAPRKRNENPNPYSEMKDQSTVKAANISARPSPMGTRQPLPRPLRSGSHFFPPNVLDDEGDSMESLSLPPTPSPNPRPPPHSLTQDASETSVPTSPAPAPPPVEAGGTSPDEETTVEDLSNSIHAPSHDEDAAMSDNSPPTYSYPSPPKPATPTEEDLLRAHLAVAETNRAIVKPSGTNSLTMIPQFTPIPAGGFPKIHLAHAAQLFDFQAPKVITAWLKVPHPKILIRVFDHDGKNPSVKGPILVERLRKAITDIAQFMHQGDKDIKVSPPCPEAIKEEADQPLSFLAYNISEETKNTILAQRIWSSLDISFAAHQFSVNTPPLLLFCLHSFSTSDTATVKNAVFKTWTDEFTSWEIAKIFAESDIPADEVHNATKEFIKTLWVERLDFKASGGISLPHYNIFAASPTSIPSVWTKLRAYLHSLTYPSELEGNGTAVNFMPCPLCHSIAHPRGLCPFPDIPLWNGPKHHNPRAPTYNLRGRGRGRRNIG
ncbi:hypothetical protein C8R48DRAFT_670527 [Suillus tomentosus]|nr:hypothetical protein C8R48DRAFT_670527 [Suillus tomentosus]